jgi:Sensors of blue-light using FAD
MISLVYVSSAKREFSEDELTALLKQSRENNARLDITGMLLYKDGNFIQVMEGPVDTVERLYQKIHDDKRHVGVIRMLAREIEQRQFSDWTMGFQDLNDPAIRRLPAYSEFLDEKLDTEAFRKDPSLARRLLEVFRRNMDLGRRQESLVSR